jgi:hypothetical protein
MLALIFNSASVGLHVRKLTSDIVTETAGFESRDTHDSHNDHTWKYVSRVEHGQFGNHLQATKRKD